MRVFPTLNSGAVCQYPAVLGSGVSVQVLRFIDGSDQRFRLQSGSRRRWHINLSLLTTAEACALEQFFVAQSGSFSAFDFADPLTGTLVANCRFGSPVLNRELTGLNAEALSLWVVETNE